MSYYLEILAVQRPFPFAVDEKRRTMFSMNFNARARGGITRWSEDIAETIQGEGLGTIGTNILIGINNTITDGDGPFINVIDTGGTQPEWTHDDKLVERLSIQIIVRGRVFSTTRDRAVAIWRLLDNSRNVELGQIRVATETGSGLLTEGGDEIVVE